MGFTLFCTFRTLLLYSQMIHTVQPWVVNIIVDRLGVTLVIFPLAVSVGATSARIHEDEKHQHDDVGNGNFPPVGFHVLQHSSTARVAIRAQNGGIVTPRRAICVPTSWRNPIPLNWIPVGESARCRWLAAPRLPRTRLC